jgi:hypothetical protein
MKENKLNNHLQQTGYDNHATHGTNYTFLRHLSHLIINPTIHYIPPFRKTAQFITCTLHFRLFCVNSGKK